MLLGVTHFSWPLDMEVRITNSKVMTGSSLSFYFNWWLLHMYTYIQHHCTHAHSLTWIFKLYDLVQAIVWEIQSLAHVSLADSPLFPYQEKWLLLDLRAHSLSVNLQSITGEISPIALLYTGWLHYKILFLDSVHHQIWLFIHRVHILKQILMKRINHFGKTRKSVQFIIHQQWLINENGSIGFLSGYWCSGNPLIPWLLISVAV